ncbi:hypothetical protein [Gimesia maris]|jgi:hypothetical protein|uniref:DUF4177 domain-containing protein n=1 Tax=Gimesia maris TaxID=122 RepID=A0A3D3R5P5_9PLAN|nr:hypothetical protein [Gimesia sp.]HCO23337.1 hypothetical protein [Gimesia maris]|tara:strand:+ start:25557 stop:26045 length:489 start_codon:yes stop_codon:yes gene_type:complete
MAIFVCKQCSHTENTLDEYIGRKARCLNCQSLGTIEAAPASTEPDIKSKSEPIMPPPSPPASVSTPEAAEKSKPADSAARDSQSLIILVILVSLLLGVQIINLFLSSPTPQRWEYDIISPRDSVVVEKLNRLGAEGWDIVSARRATGYDNEASYEMLIRRAK